MGAKVSLKQKGSGESGKKQNGDYTDRPLCVQRTVTVKLTKPEYNVEGNVGRAEFIIIICIFTYTYYIYWLGDNHISD